MFYEVSGPWAPIFCTGFFHYIVRDMDTETEYCKVAFRSDDQIDKGVAYSKALKLASLLTAEK